jgi:hypothetical protein
MGRQGFCFTMIKKIENNFYDRFMGIKPKEYTEEDWFAKFGWENNTMHKKKSDWKRIETPGADTVKQIHDHFPMTAEQLVFLMYGNSVIPIKILSAGGGSDKVVSGVAGNTRREK